MPNALSQSLAPGLIVRLSGSVQWISIPSLGINPRGVPGLSLKRLRPAPMGRAHRYVHRLSHIIVVVSDGQEEEVEEPQEE